jgi:hypothetical protein
VALGALAVAGAAGREGEGRASLVVALVLVGLSILGAGLGGARFYLHYLVQYVPSLAILSGHPGARRVLSRGPGWQRALGAVVLVLPVGLEGISLIQGRAHRYEAMARTLADGRTAAQAAGEHIRARTDPGDRILAWGWTAWPVYFWAGRRAPTPVYKPMGTLTTFNTNGAFFDGSPVQFRPGPEADALARAFEAREPAYFIYSSSYLDTFGCPVDPLKSWTRMGEALRTGYRAEAQFGDLIVFGRR